MLGTMEGNCLGVFDGIIVGEGDGIENGNIVGFCVGDRDGDKEGFREGNTVGVIDGTLLSVEDDGELLGLKVDGNIDGLDGEILGREGRFDGLNEGLRVVGHDDGLLDGRIVITGEAVGEFVVDTTTYSSLLSHKL